MPGQRGWIFAIACAAFLAASWAESANANPGCNLDDIGSAAKDTFTNLPTSCATQAADPAFYPLTGFLIGFVQTSQGQDFCNAVGGINKSFAEAQKKLTDYWGSLSLAQQDSLKSNLDQYIPGLGSIVSDIISAKSDAGGVLQLVSCACKVAEWKGPGELGSDFTACLSDALCTVQDWFHDHVSDEFGSCSGSPPPQPQLMNCRVDPCAAGINNCKEDVPVAGEQVQCSASNPGYACQGSFCFSASLFQTGQGNYCYCPSVMQNPDGFRVNDDTNGGTCLNYVRCYCPEGSKPLSDTGAGAYICICPDTGLAVLADGTCPPPPPSCGCGCPGNQVATSHQNPNGTCDCSCSCPDGQFNLGAKCVTPCANAGEVQLMDGSCCPASQANACGVCCPSGMKPDDATGSCVPAVPPKPSLPKLSPQPNINR